MSHLSLHISLDEQLLRLISKDGVVLSQYPISSSKFGVGFTEGSYKTPTGRFKVIEKYGDDAPLGTIFKSRQEVGIYDFLTPCDADLILTRIIRLEGIDPENLNTYDRFIYLHGTNQESLIGQAASMGCIRLTNHDIIELYSLISLQTEVFISASTPDPLMKKWLFIDCDSTLSSIEGIDELARIKGPECFTEIETMTHAAMNGEMPINEIFSRRLDIIQPSQSDCEQIGNLYIATVDPTAKAALIELRHMGWTPVILSGGFTPCIHPLAEMLNIKHIEAVSLYFDSFGSYLGYDKEAPTARNGGKPEIIQNYLSKHPGSIAVMVGDGISDLETMHVVEKFIACFTYIQRESLRKKVTLSITSLRDLPLLLND